MAELAAVAALLVMPAALVLGTLAVVALSVACLSSIDPDAGVLLRGSNS